MKKYSLLPIALTVLAAGLLHAQAGTIFYQAIPAAQSDVNSGISNQNQYTSAVDGGNSRGTDRVINGITLYALAATGQTSTADNATINALAGTLSNAGGASATIQADGILKEVLADMTFNNGATDGSQQEIVLDPASLEAGVTYDLRVYIGNATGQNRQVSLSFVGDGQAAVETGFFNEDDATTSAGGFTDRNQVYYINYRYAWDGDSTPGITITQRSGSAPFVLYALTNQVVPAGGATATLGGGEALQAAGAQGGLSTGQVDNESDEVGVASDDFYNSDSLNQNGQWVDVEKWGNCWQPTKVPKGWCPYTNGKWSDCDDCGWTFISDEPWAWCTYHYGRWCKVRTGCGWAWVPGKVWAPSWVSWRQGREKSCDCVGWAPLPPEAGCEINVGISTWVDHSCDIGPECYTFINIRDFGSDSYFGCGCIYEHSRNIVIIEETINITNICYNSHVNIYCGGPDRQWCNERIHELGGKEVGKVHINRYDDPGKMGGKHSRHEGDSLGLVSPKIKGGGKNHQKIADTLKHDKIDKGWGNDKKAEKQARNHIAKENGGKNPKNTKATLPADVAQKMGKHGGGQAGGGGGGQHPGGKGKNKGQGQGGNNANAGAGGAGGGGFNQHPGGKGKNKGQGQGGNNANAGAGGAGGGGFNQHPGGKGKNKGQGQGQGGNNASAGAGGAGGGGGKHPGQKQSKGGQGGMAQGGQGAQGGGGQGGQGTTSGGSGKGKHKQGGQGATTQSGQGAQGGGGQGGQGTTSGGGGKGKHKQGGQGATTQSGQGAQGAGGQGGQGATSGGGGKGKHKQGGQGGMSQGGQGAPGGGVQGGQGTTSGGGAKGRHTGGGGGGQNATTQGATQSGGGGKQQQQQVQQQPQGGGGGGGGKGGGKRAKPTPVPQ